jgi:hypothetical protein
MSRRRWDLLRDRQRIRRFGSERADVSAPLFPRPTRPQRRAPSKAQMRREAEQAIRAWRGRQP